MIFPNSDNLNVIMTLNEQQLLATMLDSSPVDDDELDSHELRNGGVCGYICYGYGLLPTQPVRTVDGYTHED